MSLFRADTLRVERDADGSAVLTIDVPGRSLNVITRQVLADLDAALDALGKGSPLPVLVVRSGKPTGFLAGADIAEFTAIADTPSAENLSATGQRVFAKLAALRTPSVAVIHGPCLGGGLELALACDYRLVFDRPGTQLGLPEVELGLLPGWGGTQRLMRIVGLERALQVILSGRRLTGTDAFRAGLADALATDENSFRREYESLLIRAVSRGKVSRSWLPIRTWRQRFLEGNPVGRRLLLRGTERLLRAKVADDMPAPYEALDAVRTGLERGFDAGIVREKEAAGRLAVSPASRNLVGLFLAKEAARKMPPDLPTPTPVKTLGLVGAGVMGAGIAQAAVAAGINVFVQEANAEALAAGMKRIDELFAKAVARGKMAAADVARRKALIRGTTTLEGFDAADLVVEAATENLDLKRRIFADLLARTSERVTLATNTSSLPVAKLAEGMSSPHRIAGLHFFNPVHRMPLVEVVSTPLTTPERVSTLVGFVVALGKIPARVGDGPGFVVNRVLFGYFDEAVRLVAEGMAPDEVDTVMRRFGMPAGPLAVLDQIGLDVAGHVGRSLSTGDAPTAAVFAEMQAAGLLGEKAGKGFFSYLGGRTYPNADAVAIVRRMKPGSTSLAALPKAAKLAEARERMVMIMVREAMAIVAEGLADAATVDAAMVFGSGWAPHRGGPLAYARSRGAEEVARVMSGLAERWGARFLSP